jgi:predicted NACHT family NTPase
MPQKLDELYAKLKSLQKQLDNDTLPGSPEEQELREQIEEIEHEIKVQEKISSEMPPPPPKPLCNDYLDWLFDQVKQVSLSGIDRKTAGKNADTWLNLGAIYTALLTLSTEQRKPITGQKQEQIDESVLLEQLIQKESGSRERRISALEQLNRYSRLVLLGDPGSGKTTFAKFVAMCMAGELLEDKSANLTLLRAPLPDKQGKEQETPQEWRYGVLLPVLVVLRDFAAKGLPPGRQRATAKHLWEFIAMSLDDAMLSDCISPLEQYLRRHGGLILLDGLDEVPEAEEHRRQIKQAVENFARRFPRCRMLATSRTYAYQQQDWRLSGFTETVLAPFSEGQIRCFIDRWYEHVGRLRGMSRDNTQGQAELLKQAIFNSKRLYSFAERPLLLTLMASLHAWRGGSLPEKREVLYNDTMELLLDWWESAKVVREPDGQILVVQDSLTELLNVGKECVKDVLAFLAFRVHASQDELEGTADIAEGDLVSKLMEVSQNKDLRPARLIEYLSDRAGLLDPRGVRVYTFPHRTFQEYLAACYLTNTDEYPENVGDIARQDPNRWREVVLLAGAKAARGFAASIWSLAEALCYRNQDAPDVISDDAWGALLAGQALIESANLQQISPRNQPKLDRIRHWLVAILTERQPSDTPFPVVERALVGNILAQLGDPRPGVGLQEDG